MVVGAHPSARVQKTFQLSGERHGLPFGNLDLAREMAEFDAARHYDPIFARINRLLKRASFGVILVDAAMRTVLRPQTRRGRTFNSYKLHLARNLPTVFIRDLKFYGSGRWESLE